ncbi:MAG: 50S ribosomal protein L18 [Saprospiraceae bacterium]
MSTAKSINKKKIQYRIRKKVSGSTSRPRLSVYRSNKSIYAQLIDDTRGVTLTAVSTHSEGIEKSGNKSVQAKSVGAALASKAKAINIEEVVFDRGGNLYHGRIKSLADGAREGGLKF